jgi:hypothetical protein
LGVELLGDGDVQGGGIAVVLEVHRVRPDARVLSRLRSAGYFKDAARRRRLTEDGSLAPLRKRPTFQEWLRQTDK